MHRSSPSACSWWGLLPAHQTCRAFEQWPVMPVLWTAGSIRHELQAASCGGSLSQGRHDICSDQAEAC